MDQYELAEISVTEGSRRREIAFSKARLTVVSESGTRLWYIEIDGIPDEGLLAWFAGTDEIGIGVEAVTIGGRPMSGRGYFHPNLPNRSAAIRGEGKLEGYVLP